MDVTSLYTNIPHDYGIAACRKIWEQRTDQEPPTGCLVEMLTLVLKNNNFTFDRNHYLQINGTAMGTKIAPSYANIFMALFPYFSACGNSVIMGNVRVKGCYIHGNKRGIF
jgi:hypothetical protein